MLSSILCCCVLSFLISVVQNANILAIIPSPFYSHQAHFRPLWRELAKKGHNITLFTTNPFEANENITVVDLSGSYDILEKYRNNGWIFHEENTWGKIKKAYSIFNDLITYQMNHPDLKRFTNPQNYNCDLIMAEVLFPNYYVLGKILDCPLIGVSSMDAFPFVHNSMGNAIHPVIYSYVDFPTNKVPTFKDRLRNSFLHTLMSSIMSIYFRELDWHVEEYIGKDLPKVSALYDSLSLLIVNANPIFYPIRPSTPLTINVGGGLHLLGPKTLPKPNTSSVCVEFLNNCATMENVFLKICLLILFCDDIYSANIIAITPTPFFTHQAAFRPLWRALGKKCHNVTLITTDPMPPWENVNQIDISETYTILEKYKTNGTIFEPSLWKTIEKFSYLAEDMMKYQLTHPKIVELKDPNNFKCDLILTELYFPSYFALGKKLKCPVIGITSMDAYPVIHEQFGNAVHPAMYSFTDFGFGDKLSFFERLLNTMITVLPRPFFPLLEKEYDARIEKYIGKNLPKTGELYRSLSLLIVNANPIFYPIRPSTPATINLGGGLHFEVPQALPQDIQTYLDGAKDGCIYFSFGSTVNSNYLAPEALEIFRKTFEELAPLKVLWKFENDTMAKKPENVELRKWLPQQDVLRHPNIKVFITQGGLQSMEEAIDSAVPMLGMPFYGDQINNVKKMVDKEFGLKLEIKTLDSNSLKNSILELLNNPKYKKNIDRLSAISKDQPMRPLEKAVWWTEYVLRHKTTEHLRSPSADIPLYQYFFLDILAFLLIVFIFAVISFYYWFKFIRWTFRAMFCKKNKVKVN